MDIITIIQLSVFTVLQFINCFHPVTESLIFFYNHRKVNIEQISVLSFVCLFYNILGDFYSICFYYCFYTSYQFLRNLLLYYLLFMLHFCDFERVLLAFIPSFTIDCNHNGFTRRFDIFSALIDFIPWFIFRWSEENIINGITSTLSSF